MTNIKVKINSTWEDISAYCTPSSTTQSRIDSAFGVGQTMCWINKNFNIPPYSLIEIDNKIYCGHSTCNKYVQNNNYYLHRLTILPLEAILAGFVIGTKAFSTTGTNTHDYEKIEIVLRMVNDSGGNFAIGDLSLLTKSKEYQYPAGATAWDIISDICKNNNARPVVEYSKTLEQFTFKTSSIIGTRKNLELQYLSNAEYVQSMDDYCKYLVTEANNVVDRTTVTHLKNLTCRSEDPILTSDNAKLILPSPIENIVDFGIQGLERDCWWEIRLITIYKSNGTAYSDGEYTGTIGTLIDNGKNPKLTSMYEAYFKKYYSTFSQYRDCVVAYNSAPGYIRLVHTNGLSGGNTARVFMNMSLSDYLLPKEKWDMLTAQIQTSYAFYEHGGETIENMFASYKDDLFNILLGFSGSPLLDRTFPAIHEETNVIVPDGTSSYSTYTVEMNVNKSEPTQSTTELPHATDPVRHVWYVDYYPICNPKITSTKSINPLNENNWKDIQRSYNNGAAYIDFDKLMSGLNKSNDMLGDVELTIELTVPEGYSTEYNSGDIISYDNTDWYISSAITNHRLEYKTITLNLVRDYSKVAESIGVDSQYNSTKNPLNSIIDRPIEFNGSFETTFTEGKNYYIHLIFKNIHDVIIANLFKCASVLKDDNNNVVFWCKAKDQYSLDVSVGTEGQSSGLTHSWYQSEHAYVDSNAECYSVTCAICELPTLTRETSKTFPVYTGIYSEITERVTKTIYKDAREHLTFTYVVNNN